MLIRKSKGIKTYLNIIACENAIKASSQLEEEVKKYLNEEEIEYLKEVFKLSQGEASFLVTCGKGEGLLKVGGDTAILQITPTAREFKFVETNLNKLVGDKK